MKKLLSSIAELERLVRAFEPGGHTLGPHLAEAGEALARRMGIDPAEFQALVDLPDEQVSQRLHVLFQSRVASRAAVHGAMVEQAALAAAQRLAATTVWHNDAVALDPGILLGDLLVDTNRAYIAFHVAGQFQTCVPRSTLVSAAQVLGSNQPDLTAWVDRAGLHFRWRGGRGGVNFFPQLIPTHETEHLLRVNLPTPVVETIRRAPAAATRMQRGLAWLTDLLAELAFS